MGSPRLLFTLVTQPHIPSFLSTREMTTTDPRNLVFVYGTLMKGLPNYTVMEPFIEKKECEFIAAAKTVNKYPLTIDNVLHNVPALLNQPNHEEAFHVAGEIYKVSDGALKFLDEFEGAPEWYNRIDICVKTDDATEYTCGAYLISTNVDILNRLLKNRPFLASYHEASKLGYKYDNYRDNMTYRHKSD